MIEWDTVAVVAVVAFAEANLAAYLAWRRFYGGINDPGVVADFVATLGQAFDALSAEEKTALSKLAGALMRGAVKEGPGVAGLKPMKWWEALIYQRAQASLSGEGGGVGEGEGAPQAPSPAASPSSPGVASRAAALLNAYRR